LLLDGNISQFVIAPSIGSDLVAKTIKGAALP
jgi:hypothetical protein